MKAFQFSINNNVAHIRLNQPALGNPFNTHFCEELNELSIECGENNNIKAVYIDAAGPNFSVGGDLKEFLGDKENLPSKFKRMTADIHMAVTRFARNNAPIIVGMCIAGFPTVAT